MRLTEQKKRILETLRERKDHPTAEEVYSLVRKQMPTISLGTVYRNLERFVAKGLALRLTSGRERRYDPTVAPHFHFRCECCGSLEDIPVEISLPSCDMNHPWFADREVVGFVLEAYGVCPVCLTKRGEMK